MERFYIKVNKTDQCWLWTAAVQKDGYGVFKYDGNCELAHRVSWLLNIGQIPREMCVLHRCDNPPCVNPSHLFLGSQTDNMADMDNKKRRRNALGTKHGKSKLTENQVIAIRKRHANGETQTNLGLFFNVDRTAIWKIVNNINWKHIQ